MNSMTDTVAFFDTTYQEALAMTEEARDYMADRRRQGPDDGQQAFDSLTASCETMRVTSRLTQVVAWLMVQKAVYAGEMTRKEAGDPNFRLAGHDVCAEDAADLEVELEPGLKSLLARSLSLYQRVARLDSLYDN